MILQTIKFLLPLLIFLGCDNATQENKVGIVAQANTMLTGATIPTLPPTDTVLEVYHRYFSGQIGNRKAKMFIKKFGFYKPYTVFYYFVDEQKPVIMSGDLLCFYNEDTTMLNYQSGGRYINVNGVGEERDAIRNGAKYEVLQVESDFNEGVFKGRFVNDSLYEGFYWLGKTKTPFKFIMNQALKISKIESLQRNYKIIDSLIVQPTESEQSDAYIDFELPLFDDIVSNKSMSYLTNELIKLTSPNEKLKRFSLNDIDTHILEYFSFNKVENYKNSDYRWGREKFITIPYYENNLIGVVVYDNLTLSIEKGNIHNLLLYAYDLKKNKRITFEDVFIKDKKTDIFQIVKMSCDVNDAQKMSYLDLNNFFITKTGVYFICPRSNSWRSNLDSPIEIFIPFDRFKGFINPLFDINGL
jgi:hypothetical protein